MRLEAIHLASHPLPPYPRQRGNGEDVLAPQTVVRLLSLIFLTTVFTSPSISLIPFFPFTCLVPSYRPSCRHFSVCLPPPSLFRSLVLRGNSPAPLRSLFHRCFSSFFLPLWLSLTHLWLILIFTNSAGLSGQYDQISVGKQPSHQREKLRGRKEKWWNTTFHTCVHHTAGLIIINEEPNNKITWVKNWLRQSASGGKEPAFCCDRTRGCILQT